MVIDSFDFLMDLLRLLLKCTSLKMQSINTKFRSLNEKTTNWEMGLIRISQSDIILGTKQLVDSKETGEI